jgi:hypothetical protein
VVARTGVPKNTDSPESTLHPTTLRKTWHAQIEKEFTIRMPRIHPNAPEACLQAVSRAK